MENRPTDARNIALDEVIAARRSIRSFTDEIPDLATVKLILEAGIAAPHAAAAVGSVRDYRRFIVLPRSSESIETVICLLRETGKRALEGVQNARGDNARFIRRLEALVEGRLPGLGTAPYLIIVAELKGVPAVQQQSIAHCLQNMWLKATALNLGFHLVSALAMLADEPRFWRHFDLPPDTYDLNGCAIGKPAKTPASRPRAEVSGVTIWAN